nr:TRAP transporter large permease subunit [Pseudoroseicyclus tamaricis]
MNYDPRLFSGAVAARATLGIMIPPSINVIVYGLLSPTTVPQLIPAGLIKASFWRWLYSSTSCKAPAHRAECLK